MHIFNTALIYTRFFPDYHFFLAASVLDYILFMVHMFRAKMGASLNRTSKEHGVGGKPPYLKVKCNLVNIFVSCLYSIYIYLVVLLFYIADK